MKRELVVNRGVIDTHGHLLEHTKTLRNSIKVEKSGDLEFTVVFDVPYASALEKGRTQLMWLPFLDANGNMTNLGQWALDKFPPIKGDRDLLERYKGIKVNKEHPYVQPTISHSLEAVASIITNAIADEISAP